MQSTQSNTFLLDSRFRLLLYAAGGLSSLMALFHFLIPYVYPWEQHVGDLYPPVRWALFAINFAYSCLLLWGSLLTLLVIRRPCRDALLAGSILGGIAGCWLAGALYELIVPFPVDGVRWVLPTFALMTGLLYLVPLIEAAWAANRSPRAGTHEPNKSQ